MDKIKYDLPLITINSIEPSISYDGIVYASKISANWGKMEISLYETEGLDYSKFIGQEVECVIEITRGEVIFTNPENAPSSCFGCQYIWDLPPDVFFPKLREMLEFEDRYGFDSKEDALKFEDLASRTLSEWGHNGFGIKHDQRKPMLLSEQGIFLLNEWEFEEEIESWRLNQEIFIEIFEGLLRGIRPYIPPEDRAPELTAEQKAEQARRQALHQERLEAYEAMQERIRIRRANGEGPSLV